MRTDAIRRTQRVLLLILILAVVAAGLWAGRGARGLQGLFGAGQTLAGRQIGIVAGHSGNDSGAVCPDGLTEASVNQAVAERVVRDLKARGATVALLAEFDGRLAGYRADAFVSIHADSCQFDLSGFKVASLAGGSRESAQLADCLWARYAAATGLARHEDTITYDIRGYHAFREIAAQTPAAIIEIGFLRGDRELLTKGQERAAAGIVAGLECFLAAGK